MKIGEEIAFGDDRKSNEVLQRVEACDRIDGRLFLLLSLRFGLQPANAGTEQIKPVDHKLVPVVWRVPVVSLASACGQFGVGQILQESPVRCAMPQHKSKDAKKKLRYK